jgi:hypothetical protein
MMRNASAKAVSNQSQTKQDIKPLSGKAVKVLADSIYQTLKDEGCEEKDIIGVSSQLISLVTARLEAE